MPATIVLLHGFAGTGRAWDPVVARLDGERYTALAPDLRGHGSARDRAPATLAAMAHDVLGAAPPAFALCGYSLGGRVALHVALAAPERVRRLVLVATTAGIDDPGERAARRTADERLAAQIERDGLAAFADAWLAGPLFHADPPGAQERARADIARNDPSALAAALRGAGTGTMHPLWDRLGELAMPVTVLTGARDAKFCALAERLCARLPGAQLGVVAGAGHALPRLAPAALADAIDPTAHALLGRIRDAAPQDAEDLAGIHRRASLVWPEYRADLLARPELFGVDAGALAAGRVRIACDADGLPLGFATTAPAAGGAWELEDLFVEPRAMARGIGRALVDDAVVRASEAGTSRLAVVAGPAAGFYARLGFADAGAADTALGPARRLTLDL